VQKEAVAMTTAPHDPLEEVPEADRLEQQTPVDPQPLPDPETVSGVGPGPVDTDETVDTVDEADRLEQETPVSGEDEDDYPREG
jgi:hypothetical protein